MKVWPWTPSPFDSIRPIETKHQLAVQLHWELVAEQSAARPLTREAHPELARILDKPRVVNVERES